MWKCRPAKCVGLRTADDRENEDVFFSDREDSRPDKNEVESRKKEESARKETHFRNNFGLSINIYLNSVQRNSVTNKSNIQIRNFRFKNM